MIRGQDFVGSPGCVVSMFTCYEIGMIHYLQLADVWETSKGEVLPRFQESKTTDSIYFPMRPGHLYLPSRMCQTQGLYEPNKKQLMAPKPTFYFQMCLTRAGSEFQLGSYLHVFLLSMKSVVGCCPRQAHWGIRDLRFISATFSRLASERVSESFVPQEALHLPSWHSPGNNVLSQCHLALNDHVITFVNVIL